MVTVLLAVYNGERYLAQQINSLLEQTVKDIKIIIRDDGSCDRSAEIISDFAKRYPEKISVISGAPTGSALGNFSQLVKSADDDYIMFCDQDDVWLPEKIEKTLSVMQTAEKQTPDTPILVHSDVSVVDSNLHIVSPSFFEYQRLYQDNVCLPRLLVQNYVTGCTVMINRALLDICGEIPDDCAMHDWWLALVAVIFGRIVCIDEPLMLYRQHGDNQVGAKSSHGMAYIRNKLATLDKVRTNYNITYTQARRLNERYRERMNRSQCEILDAYCLMPQKNKLQKIRLMNKYGFKKGTTLRIIGQYFLM